MKLKEALKGKLTKAERDVSPSSFDVVGDIAIFNEINPTLKKKEKIIAQTLLTTHPHLHVVLKKTGKYTGKLRTPTLSYLAGEKRKTTRHKENNCVFELDVEKCYFSTRTGSERQRVYNQVKKGESVLVMFSGIGPFVIEIAKNTSAKEVYGIELNKIAHKYAVKNASLNKVQNVQLFQGDVKRVLPTMKKSFDRIIMPLPKEASKHLDLALKHLTQRGVIHLYIFEEGKNVKEVARACRQKFKSVKAVRCGQYAPRVYRICLDLRK